jgi:hypothetical protein
MKFKLQDKKQCYVSHRTDGLQKHHIIYGTANRKQSDKYGLTVWLRPEYHTGQTGVHGGNKTLDLELKQMAQREFEKVYSHEKWMEVFKRNYL